MKIKRITIRGSKNCFQVPEAMKGHNLNEIIRTAEYNLYKKGDHGDFKIIVEVERGTP